jgi:hypothetical protein
MSRRRTESDHSKNVVRHHGKMSLVALTTRVISGNEVRVPDPRPGEATIISRYGKARAMLIHPSDFHRLSDLDRMLADVSNLEPLALSAEAARAHREEDTPGEPITDPAVLAELFG